MLKELSTDPGLRPRSDAGEMDVTIILLIKLVTVITKAYVFTHVICKRGPKLTTKTT